MKKPIPLILLTALVGCAENVLVFDCVGNFTVPMTGEKFEASTVLVIDKFSKTMKFGVAKENKYRETSNTLQTDVDSRVGVGSLSFNKMTNTLVQTSDLFGNNKSKCTKIENHFD
ncbi:hypothetical protein OA404_01045 [SAR86 cluster bacterium]|nr:hypothetical protein [SAR86 cluster bacterium]